MISEQKKIENQEFFAMEQRCWVEIGNIHASEYYADRQKYIRDYNTYSSYMDVWCMVYSAVVKMDVPRIESLSQEQQDMIKDRANKVLYFLDHTDENVAKAMKFIWTVKHFQ